MGEIVGGCEVNLRLFSNTPVLISHSHGRLDGKKTDDRSGLRMQRSVRKN